MLAGQSVSYDQPNLGSAEKAPGEVSKYIVVEDHSQVVEDYSPKQKNLREILAMNHIPGTSQSTPTESTTSTRPYPTRTRRRGQRHP